MKASAIIYSLSICSGIALAGLIAANSFADATPVIAPIPEQSPALATVAPETIVSTATESVSITGPPGVAGSIGPMGPIGPQGIQGPAGADGQPGTDGADGANGAAGEPGPVGPIGPQGESGPAGPAGEPGASGAAGAPGSTGATGPPGESASACPPGFELTQISVHQREPIDTDRLVTLCAASEPGG